MLSQLRTNLVGSFAGTSYIKNNNVRGDLFRIDLDARKFRQAFSQKLCVGMILRQMLW